MDKVFGIKNNKMKIGIALGGGGAKGFAHLGVLNALGEAGIDCDIVAGTSIGALIGAVYASGDISGLEGFATNLSLTDLPFLLGPTWPSQGLFSGNYVEKLLRDFVPVSDIEKLDKPFAAVCVDLRKAELLTFKEGDLHLAVRASMSIPGLFKPVIFEDKLLVDGGVLESVPVRAARELGADLVIAVDLLTDLSESGDPGGDNSRSLIDHLRSIGDKLYIDGLFDGGNTGGWSLIDIVQRSSVIAQRCITQYRFEKDRPEIVIRPSLSHVKVMDFHRGRQIIERGRAAAEEVLPDILRLTGKD